MLLVFQASEQSESYLRIYGRWQEDHGRRRTRTWPFLKVLEDVAIVRLGIEIDEEAVHSLQVKPYVEGRLALGTTWTIFKLVFSSHDFQDVTECDSILKSLLSVRQGCGWSCKFTEAMKADTRLVMNVDSWRHSNETYHGHDVDPDWKVIWNSIWH